MLRILSSQRPLYSSITKRYQSDFVQKHVQQKIQDIQEEFLKDEEPTEPNRDLLPFSIPKSSETYGMLVRSEGVENVKKSLKINVIERTELINEKYLNRPSETNSRFLEDTIKGKFITQSTDVPSEIAKVIRNNVLKVYHKNIPALRNSAAEMFKEIEKTKIHQPPRNLHEVDSHVLTVFQQNYASLVQILGELKKFVESKEKVFNPIKVLDIGYGPATGIIALNELMGPDYEPDLRHAYISGNKNGSFEMAKRAKLLLSRQISEVNMSDLSPEQQKELLTEEEEEDDDEKDEFLDKKQRRMNRYAEEDELAGVEIDTKRLKIKTKILREMPKNKQYDLIIVTHQLLKDSSRFPVGLDDLIEEYLSLLQPGGHLVILERGNPTGFETIARARQIMFRPENYSRFEFGKIPRPWIRGSSIKPQRNKIDQFVKTEIDDDFKEFEDGFIEEDELKLEVTEKDLQIEDEIKDNFDIIDPKNLNPDGIHCDYYLKLLAPYPHHLKDSYQMKDPKYFENKKAQKIKFLSFSLDINRPKYSMEFKKGKTLSSNWNEDGLKKNKFSGSGRPDANNYETVNYNYLTIERTHKDKKTLQKIENLRNQSKEISERLENLSKDKTSQEFQELLTKHINSSIDNSLDQWPRIIRTPMKNKGHVIFLIMTPQGKIEKWILPKSYGASFYHDARKSKCGDLWKFSKTQMVLIDSDLTQAEKFKIIVDRAIEQKAKAQKLKKNKLEQL